LGTSNRDKPPGEKDSRRKRWGKGGKERGAKQKNKKSVKQDSSKRKIAQGPYKLENFF